MSLWHRIFSDPEGIGGYHFYHYGSCQTRLWLYHRNVEVGMENDHIKIGRIIDESTFRGMKRLTIPGLCSIDFIRESDGMEVHEVKKGRRESDAHRFQVLYYIEVIESITGVPTKGFIHYPQSRRVVDVERDPETVSALFERISEIICGGCPSPIRVPICRGCSYEEMCWA